MSSKTIVEKYWFFTVGTGLACIFACICCCSENKNVEMGGSNSGPNARNIVRPVGNNDQMTDQRKLGSQKVSRPMGNSEVWAFLRETKIDRLDLVDVSVPEGILVVNRLLHQKMPDHKRPRIILADAWQYDDRSSRKVAELRVHDVPVGTVLRYICDQSRCVYWVYDGAVVVDAYRMMEVEDYERYLNQPKIRRLDIPDANLLEAVAALELAAREVDFNARKPWIGMPVTHALRAAIESGELAGRVAGLHMRNITIGEALREICKRTGSNYEFFEGEIHVRLPENSEAHDQGTE